MASELTESLRAEKLFEISRVSDSCMFVFIERVKWDACGVARQRTAT